MLHEIAPLLTLFIAAGLILAGGQLARRLGLSQTIGRGVALCIAAAALGFSPAEWRAGWTGGVQGDRLLTYARIVGLTGLMFLAGNRFSAERVRKRHLVSFAVFGVLSFTTASLLLTSLLQQPIGIAALVGATIVSSSLWLPAQVQSDSSTNHINRSSTTLAVLIVLTATALLGFHVVGTLAAIPRSHRSLSSYLIVALYELVKVAVVFAFAYFISTRFVARAEGRISAIRTHIAFTVICVLLYALISVVVGPIGAIAWAFFAGALWHRTNNFGERSRPVASALLLSLVFLSLPLQSHGRQFAFSLGLLITITVAIALKTLFAAFVLKGDSTGGGQGHVILPEIAFPGEIAILLLSVSVNRWFIDGQVFFAILVYSIASTLLVPILHQVLTRRRTISSKGARLVKRRMKTVF